MYCPFTGLGLYNGFRGNRWLGNRIKIFKQFVVPSLQAQTNQDFTLWISWRREERHNPLVLDLIEYLKQQSVNAVHTFAGVCFYDDKFNDEEARLKLINAIHGSMGGLLDAVGECDHVLMTIQPSDDCYYRTAVEGIQQVFKQTDLEGVGFTKGYICNYLNKEVSEYNPNTNPPFYTIKFPRETFIDPLKHYNFTALKQDVGKYKQGTACPSHEYVKDCVKYGTIDVRGFLVGCHSENISTYYDHPFKGVNVSGVLPEFGLEYVKELKLKPSLRKWVLKNIPHPYRKKLRYLSERTYNWLRA